MYSCHRHPTRDDPLAWELIERLNIPLHKEPECYKMLTGAL